MNSFVNSLHAALAVIHTSRCCCCCCSGCRGWPSREDKIAQRRTRNCCAINMDPDSIGSKSMREYAFMMEPRMIYGRHKCASCDIAELGGIYIPNELSIKRSLNLRRVWTVIKTRLLSEGDETSVRASTYFLILFHNRWNRIIVIFKF